MQSYEDLHAWQRAMDLVEEVYGLSAILPISEQYGLTAPLRKAANSVAANAEGFGRYTFPDKSYTYTIAFGECTEVEIFLHIALRGALFTVGRG